MSSNYSNNAELYGHEDGVCDNCGEEVSEDFVLTNAYGDQLCEDCWDEYINSEEGLVEYVIGLATTDYDITDFDEDELVNLALSWYHHKSELNLSAAAISKIEADATAAGLNFHPTDPNGNKLIERLKIQSRLKSRLRERAASKKVILNTKTNQFISDLYIRERIDIEYTTNPREALELCDDCKADNKSIMRELEKYQPNTFKIVEI